MILRSLPRAVTACFVLVASIFGATGAARAQGWLADRQRTEGPGIRLGDFELHPGIGVELGYDSNVYYTADNPAPGLPQRVESAILRVTPHLLVSTEGAQRQAEGESSGQTAALPDVTFRGGLWASYYEFFADERRRNLSLDAGIRVNFLPGRAVSFSIYDDFSRSIRPFVENFLDNSTARDQNSAGLDVTFSTHGNVFQVRTGYRFQLDYFEGASFQYGNNGTHTITLQETFRFLPQTGIVHDTQVAYRDYFNPDVSPVSEVHDGLTVTSRLGINGAITPEISLLAMFGYSAGWFFSDLPGYDQDYDSVVAQAQLAWAITQGVQLSIGYTRTFVPSFIGNYSSQDRGYAQFQMLFGGSFLLGIGAGVAYVDFGQVIGAPSPTCPNPCALGVNAAGVDTFERTDVRVDASLFAEYRFTDWLGVNGTVSYLGDFTDFRYKVAPLGSGVFDPAGYNKFEAWFGVRVFY
jgi:hypothetical protein